MPGGAAAYRNSSTPLSTSSAPRTVSSVTANRRVCRPIQALARSIALGVQFGAIRKQIKGISRSARSHVLAAKVLAGALAGIAFGVLGEAMGWAIGYVILDGRGITIVLTSSDVLLLTLGGSPASRCGA